MSTSSPRPSAVLRTEITEGWRLTVTGGPAPMRVVDLPVEVPGSFVPDLEAAGLIPDPYLDCNEEQLQWTGECDLSYRTRIRPVRRQAPVAGERLELVADSLDTVATVLVNGQEVARTRNQHLRHRIDVTEAVGEADEVDLEVRFQAPLAAIREAEQEIGALPHDYEHAYNALRKAACSFGWDWGPVLVSSGIVAPIALEQWSTARLGEVRPRITVEEGTGLVDLALQVRAADPAVREVPGLSARLLVEDPQGRAVAETAAPAAPGTLRLRAQVPAARLWWPRGYGQQPLYTVTVELRDAAGEVLDRLQRRVGFRTAGVVEQPDRIGTSFMVHVNDRPVLVKGANWIPAEVFPSRVTEQLVRDRLTDAVEAGMNMIRVWGGGLYESELFYELASEAGLMVWQDVAMACSTYSEHPALAQQIEAELRQSIVRLAWHPSLVHWNGGNECVEAYLTWGYKEQMPPGAAWGEGYILDLVPRLLAELDPTRSYSPNSPYSCGNPEDPKDLDHGTAHNWRVWNEADWVHYADDVPRFAAEFGFQAPAAYATIASAITERPLVADSPAMLSHQKAEDGQRKLVQGYRHRFPEPRTVDDFLLVTQLNQARALRFGISHYRSHWPVCAGTIIWQLNDCWPVTSWSAVDSAGRRKPLWYALRDVHAPRLLAVQGSGGQLRAVLCNDTDEVCQEVLHLRLLSLEGAELASHRAPVTVAARSVGGVPVPAPLAQPAHPEASVLVLEREGAEGLDGSARLLHWFAPDRDLLLDPGALRARAEVDGEDVLVHLEAAGAVREACVFADRVHPALSPDRQLVDLLPGQRATVRVRGTAEVPASSVGGDPALWCSAPVLRSVNDLLGR